MKLNLLIAPDFAPERFAGWHMLNTVVQKKSGLHIRLLTPPSAAEQVELIEAGEADAVYANPFDASAMIRDAGYTAIARPIGKPDEMVIFTKADSALNEVPDLKPGCKIALTDNSDVRLIGLRLLEVADLKEDDVQWAVEQNYQAAARQVIKGEADAGFLLLEAYNSLSRLTKSQVKVLVESKIADISHVVLTHPRMEDRAPALKGALLGLAGTPDGQPALDALGIEQGFEAMEQEDAEFMVDVMETLLD